MEAVDCGAALTATRALHLPQAAFDSLQAAQDPVAARVILGPGWVLAGRLRSVNEQYAALGHAPGLAAQMSPAAGRSSPELSIEQTTRAFSETEQGKLTLTRSRASVSRRKPHHPLVFGSPLNGPASSLVIQPP